MVQLLTDRDDWICEWVAKRIPGYEGSDFKPCSSLGVARDGNLLAGMIFNNFRPKSRDIHFTIAADSPKWASREVVSFVFNYVFNQLGCTRMTLIISKKNKRARKLAEGLGFQYEGKLRQGFDGIQDAIIYAMLSKECRWLGENHEQKYARRA